MHRIVNVLVPAAIVAMLSAAVGAQTAVTQADIQQLQDSLYLAERDVTAAQSRDAARASALKTELETLGEEVIYLKVKLRKERALARTEYNDVRDRIESVRTRARGETASAPRPAAPAPAATGPVAPPPPPRPAAGTAAGAIEVPTGTEMDVRLQTTLNSGRAVVEDRFEATTLVDLSVGSRVAIPAGSVARGVVTGVEPATRTNRTGRITVSFDQVTVNGRAYPMRGTVTQALESEGIRGELPRVGAGAGVGAIIGGILGGFKGAMAGILIGGGGTIAATEGKEVDLPQGTVLRVRLDSPLQIAAR
jgi:hypothetical protein